MGETMYFQTYCLLANLLAVFNNNNNNTHTHTHQNKTKQNKTKPHQTGSESIEHVFLNSISTKVNPEVVSRAINGSGLVQTTVENVLECWERRCRRGSYGWLASSCSCSASTLGNVSRLTHTTLRAVLPSSRAVLWRFWPMPRAVVL